MSFLFLGLPITTEAMGILRFTGAFAVVERQGECGSKTTGMHGFGYCRLGVCWQQSVQLLYSRHTVVIYFSRINFLFVNTISLFFFVFSCQSAEIVRKTCLNVQSKILNSPQFIVFFLQNALQLSNPVKTNVL